MNKVRVGILGCANVAERYAIRAFQSIENALVVSIASRSYSKAKRWAARFGIRAERSYNALLSSKDIDAVYIPLPIGLHRYWALKAVAANKHIMCEKSLAENFTSTLEIVNACRANGLVLYENFMCDFHPQHAKVQSLIRNRAIGKPYLFRSSFGFPPFKKSNIRYDKALGGGSLADAGAYTVFMARKLFNKEPVAVTCRLVYDKKRAVDVRGHAMLEFPDNQVASIAFSYDAAYQNNYSLWGSRGLINVGRAYSISPTTEPNVELVSNDGDKDRVTTVAIPAANHFEMIFRDFCNTILHKRTMADKIGRAYEKMVAQARVLEALRVASREKRRVLTKL